MKTYRAAVIGCSRMGAFIDNEVVGAPGHVPPYSVVVSGSLPGKPLPDGSPGPNLYCAVIVKTVDERTRSKTSLNELLRD